MTSHDFFFSFSFVLLPTQWPPKHDRDAKFCAAFDGILKAVGIQAVKLPPQSPNLNSHLERWHRSVREECLSKLILFGERSLQHALSNYVSHFYAERNHQGKDNAILFLRPPIGSRKLRVKSAPASDSEACSDSTTARTQKPHEVFDLTGGRARELAFQREFCEIARL
jgi:hypothetical protein